MRSTDSKSSSRKTQVAAPQAPLAASLVSPEAPLAELTHEVDAYGQQLRYSFDGTRAILTPQDGPPVSFDSKPDEHPSAYERAYLEAKDAWKAGVLADDLQRKQEREQKIKAAADLNRRKGDE